MIDNITGPDPAESDPAPREYTVTIKLTLTRVTMSSATRIDDDIHAMVDSVEGLIKWGSAFEPNTTDFYAEAK